MTLAINRKAMGEYSIIWIWSGIFRKGL